MTLNQLKFILGYTSLDLILSGVSVREAVETELDEKSVHLNGAQWSKSGNCVVLAGGTGSGKGWVKDNLIAADFQQVFDVDKMKDLYINNVKSGRIKDDKTNYDLGNPEDVSDLHQKVKNRNWDKHKQKLMLTNADKLPNVLFDITGSKTSKLESIGKQAKAAGYNVILIWVVTPRQIAILGNLTRNRKVSQDVFHNTHNDVIDSVFSFLDGLADDYDEAFVVFNPGKNISDLPDTLQGIAKKYDIIKLEDMGSSFKIPADIKKDILDFLGKQDDPKNLQHYKDFKDIDVKQGFKGVNR